MFSGVSRIPRAGLDRRGLVLKIGICAMGDPPTQMIHRIVTPTEERISYLADAINKPMCFPQIIVIIACRHHFFAACDVPKSTRMPNLVRDRSRDLLSSFVRRDKYIDPFVCSAVVELVSFGRISIEHGRHDIRQEIYNYAIRCAVIKLDINTGVRENLIYPKFD